MGWPTSEASPEHRPRIFEAPNQKPAASATFQNRKTMCYAALVAVSVGPDRKTRSSAPGPAYSIYSRRARKEVLHTTAEVDL